MKYTIVTLLLLFAVPGSVFAQNLPSPGLLPGHPLYFIERTLEGIGTFFTFGQEAKINRMIYLAEKRLAEVQALAERGNIDRIEGVMNRYEDTMERALVRAQEAGIREASQRISDAPTTHARVLNDILERVPEEAQEAIQRAQGASMRGHEEATRSIEQGAPDLNEVVPEDVQERIPQDIPRREGETLDISPQPSPVLQ